MEGDVRVLFQRRGGEISIHSLRMEGDEYEAEEIGRFLDISIHSLRMEGDHSGGVCAGGAWIFQSTPSVWRETRPVP